MTGHSLLVARAEPRGAARARARSALLELVAPSVCPACDAPRAAGELAAVRGLRRAACARCRGCARCTRRSPTTGPASSSCAASSSTAATTRSPCWSRGSPRASASSLRRDRAGAAPRRARAQRGRDPVHDARARARARARRAGRSGESLCARPRHAAPDRASRSPPAARTWPASFARAPARAGRPARAPARRRGHHRRDAGRGGAHAAARRAARSASRSLRWPVRRRWKARRRLCYERAMADTISIKPPVT